MTPEGIWLAGLAAGIAIGACVGAVLAFSIPTLVDFAYRVRRDRWS